MGSWWTERRRVVAMSGLAVLGLGGVWLLMDDEADDGVAGPSTVASTTITAPSSTTSPPSTERTDPTTTSTRSTTTSVTARPATTVRATTTTTSTAPPAPATTAAAAPSTEPPPVSFDLGSDPSCTISTELEVGDEGADVGCLEQRLAEVTSNGLPFEVDDTFGEDTAAAVRQFQGESDLTVDGVVGPQTAGALGIWD